MEYLEWKKIKYLKHTGSISDYVKEFSSLMLEAPEAPGMNEKALLFKFMDNLQGLTKQKLRRRGVRDLATAMVAAESLMDYKESKSSDDKGSKGSHITGGGEEVPPNTARYGKGKVPYTREDKGKRKQREFAPKLKCFLCDGPHLTRECPKRKSPSALSTKMRRRRRMHT